VGEAVAAGVQQMLAKSLNCPTTSSAGRWFDAAAGALALSVRQTDEAQAAIALETAAARWLAQHPPTTPLPGAVIDAQNRLDLRGLMPALFDADATGVDAAAAGFHLALADALAAWATRAARERGCRDVCLGGGCFFNRILRERVTERLQAADLRVHRPLEKGCGDAGLAIGQAWVAAQQRAATPQNISSKETEPCA
jgi:hydrogenase maturation protein HypF